MTVQGAWLDTAIRRQEASPDFVAQRLSVGFVEDILELMERRGVAQTALADKLQVSKAYVSRLFSAPPNLTLRSMAQLSIAIGADVIITVADKYAVSNSGTDWLGATGWVETARMEEEPVARANVGLNSTATGAELPTAGSGFGDLRSPAVFGTSEPSYAQAA